MGSARLAGARLVAFLAVACALGLAVATPIVPARAAEPTAPPIQVPAIVDFAVGSQHGCVIAESGEVWCWGFATDGALGAGPATTSSDVPVRAELPRPAVAIAAGFEGTCAITDDGAAWCWGGNESGEVGDGTLVDRFVPTRVVGLPGRAISISRGHGHACAVLDDGSAWCWGDNSVGQLGTRRLEGSRDREPAPVRVPGVPELVAISAGESFTCGVTRGGAAWCWGTDLYDETGRGDESDSYVPGPVAGLDDGVDRLDAGADRACAIRGGTLLCWGFMRPDLAESGGREAAIEPVPAPVDLGGAPAVDVDASNGDHLCALDADGTTWCWGNAEAGQLGPSVPADTVSVATRVRQELPPATAVRTGYDFSCALLAPDDLRCWGDGDPVARNPWTGETGPPAGGFREPGPLVPTVTTYIPTPADVSTDPPVVGANLLLAALVMILFTIAGELLNRTLAENEDAFASRGGVLARLRGARRRLDGALERVLGRGRVLTAVQLAGIAAIYGLVFSLLDRTWDPLSVTGLWLFLTMAVAFGVVGIADDLACWTVARRWGVATGLDLRPGNLLAAVTSTAASRVAALLPGVMIGMPEALEVDVEALDDRRRTRLAAVGLGTLAIIGAVAWGITLATTLAGSSGDEGAAVLLGGIEAFFLVVFAVTVQNGFAQLLAFRGTPGRVLRTTHRWAWLGALLLVTFLFWHTLVNPRGDLAEALGETNVVAFVATAGGFVAVSGAMWAWFRLRKRTAMAPASGGIATSAPTPDGADGHLAEPPAPATTVPAQASTTEPGPLVAPGGPAIAAAVLPGAGPLPDVATAVPVVVADPAAGVSSVVPPAIVAPAVPPSPAAWAPDAGIAFDLEAIANRRLAGPVRLFVRPDGIGLAGSWVRMGADRAFGIVNRSALLLLVVGAGGLALLTTVPGFRFYQVPWLLPSAAVGAVLLATLSVVAKAWRSRQVRRGEVVVPVAQLVSVRASLDRSRLALALLVPPIIGGVIYATVVGPKVVRLRGPFDPERQTAVEIRLRCHDRDEAADIVARIWAIRGDRNLEVGWT